MTLSLIGLFFLPFAGETLGAIGPSSLNSITDIGRLVAHERQEPRECKWLLQRISLAIVRGNANSSVYTSAGISRLDRV